MVGACSRRDHPRLGSASSPTSWRRGPGCCAPPRRTCSAATGTLPADLTQTALTKLYLAWRRIDRRESVDAYARRVLVRSLLDEKRRPWRREHAVAELPERPGRPDRTDDRLDLLAALARLPARQRAAVVLRHWSDLGIAETAEVLGVTEGTVKSTTSKGLAALREALQDSRTGGTAPERTNR